MLHCSVRTGGVNGGFVGFVLGKFSDGDDDDDDDDRKSLFLLLLCVHVFRGRGIYGFSFGLIICEFLKI